MQADADVFWEQFVGGRPVNDHDDVFSVGFELMCGEPADTLDNGENPTDDEMDEVCPTHHRHHTRTHTPIPVHGTRRGLI